MAQALLGISPDRIQRLQARFPARSQATARRLKGAGRTLVTGYNTALQEPEMATLDAKLSDIEPEWQGFAYEGAAMATTLLDWILPGRSHRWLALLSTAGDRHPYMLHVGAGWAVARLHHGAERVMRRGDPLLRWLVIDGIGFYHGYLQPRWAIQGRRRPRRLSGYARHVFDQGLGRALWFACGADPERVVAELAGFPTQRQGDLWAGIGLASAYIGGAEPEDLDWLHARAGPHRCWLGQGAAFAAKARTRAGNLTAPTQWACERFCGMAAGEAARITDTAQQGLPEASEWPAYEHWRRGIAARLQEGRSEWY